MKSLTQYTALLLLASGVGGCAEQDPLDQADELISRKRYSYAVAIYNDILAENPKSVAALIGRGRAHAASGKPKLAIKDFSAAILIDPHRPEAFYRRAMAYETLGDLAAAQADHDSAHAVDPNYRFAFANVAPPSSASSGSEEDDVHEPAPVVEESDALTPEQDTANGTGDGGWWQPATRLSWTDEWRNEEPEDQPAVPLRRQDPNAATLPWTLKPADIGSKPLGQVDDSRFATPFWLRPDVAPGGRSAPTKRAASTPKAVTRPTPSANPYVRTPESPASHGTPAPASNGGGTGRPTVSPFPQAPPPSTGRKS